MNKKTLLALCALFTLAVGYFIYLYINGNASQDNFYWRNVGSDVNNAPMSNAPELNPVEKTNPFKSVKTNPFE